MSKLYLVGGVYLCRRHHKGTCPGDKPFFAKGCHKCEELATKDPSRRERPPIEPLGGRQLGKELFTPAAQAAARRRKIAASLPPRDYDAR